MFIYRGTSSKVTKISGHNFVQILLYYWFVYVYQATTSSTRTGNLIQNKLHILDLVISMSINMFDMKYQSPVIFAILERQRKSQNS